MPPREPSPNYPASPEHKEVKMAFDVAVESQARHEPNQDSFLADAEHGLIAVFDGAGGHTGGAEASATALHEFQESYHLAQESNTVSASSKLSDALDRANEGVHRLNHDKGWEALTTAAAAQVYLDSELGYRLSAATVGDSRIYLFNKFGQLKFVSLDNARKAHVNNNAIHAKRDEQTRTSHLVDARTDKDKIYFGHRHVISEALGYFDGGTDPVEVNEPVAAGDVVLALSDGVTDNLTDSEIARIVGVGGTAQETARRLKAAAWQRGQGGRDQHVRAKVDDTTAVVMICSIPPIEPRALPGSSLEEIGFPRFTAPPQIEVIAAPAATTPPLPRPALAPETGATKELVAPRDLEPNETVIIDVSRTILPFAIKLAGVPLIINGPFGSGDNMWVEVHWPQFTNVDPITVAEKMIIQSYAPPETLGRRASVDMLCDLPTIVSRHHVEISLSGSQLHVHNLQPQNGTSIARV